MATCCSETINGYDWMFAPVDSLQEPTNAQALIANMLPPRNPEARSKARVLIAGCRLQRIAPMGSWPNGQAACLNSFFLPRQPSPSPHYQCPSSIIQLLGGKYTSPVHTLTIVSVKSGYKYACGELLEFARIQLCQPR